MPKLFRSGLQVAFWTGISKIFGLLRDLFLAANFGSGALADSVNVMLKLPSFFRRVLAEGAIASVFIPTFNEKWAASKEEAEEFSNQVFFFLVCLACALVAFIEICMPFVITMLAPGFHAIPNQVSETVLLCRITMPYLVLVTSVGFFSNVLSSFSRFFAPAFNPVLLSVVIILAVNLPVSPSQKPLLVALGLLVAGFCQLAFVLFCLKSSNTNIPSLPKNIRANSVSPFFFKLLPAGIASCAGQIQILISQALASFFEGAISVLSYADRIYQFPFSILGVAFSSVMLQFLSQARAESVEGKVQDMQDKCIKVVWMLSLPCAIGMAVLAHPAIELIYQRGSFSVDATRKVACTLQLLCIGLPAVILSKIVNNAFYIHYDTKALLKITSFGLLLNTLLNLIFVYFIGYLGIAVGTSAASWVQLFILLRVANKKGYFALSFSSIKWLLEVSCLSIALWFSLSQICAYFSSCSLNTWLIGKIIWILMAIAIGGFLYLSSLFLVGKIRFSKGKFSL